ncbi:MAG: AAA family ATPase [Polyangiaceae bacterium]
MGLSGLEVDSYRAFALPARLTLRPLTLVFGHNSRGKSALVRTLPLLAASATRESGGPLNLRSPAAGGASFAEIKAQHHPSPTVGFQIEWSDDRAPVRRLKIRILGGGARSLEYVEQMEAFDASGASCLKLLLKDDVRSLYDIRGGERGVEPSPELVDVPVKFDGLLPSFLVPPERTALRAAQEGVRARLAALHDEVHWLKGTRVLPERRPELKGRPPPVSPTGASAAEHLAFSSLGDRSLIEEVSAFYRSATDHELNVDPVSIGGAKEVALTLSPLTGPPVRVNILDTGEGMAQVLPVLVLGAMAKLGELGEAPVLVLEHPELHLHPRAHQEVARFLCAVAASRPDARIVVETHSENFLSEVQLCVLDEILAADQVAVNWVWADEGGAAVQLLAMDDLARIEAWPPQVFSEDSLLKREILKRRRARMEQQGMLGET